MVLWLLANVAWPAPTQPIVAVGDGIVVPAQAPAPPSAGAPGAWVAVLADCLEERAPGRFAVIDRAKDGETLASFREKLGSVRELQPAWVVVTLGARELAVAETDPKAAGAELVALVGKLLEPGAGRSPSVVVVGPVPPALPDPERQAAADARVKAFDEVVVPLGSKARGVFLVDPLSDWLASGQPRAGLVGASGGLSDQGQAKVAASVCDVVLGQR